MKDKTVITQAAPDAAPDFTESIVSQLESDALTGERWWNGPHADFLVDVADSAPFVVALGGLIEVLREGVREPLWVLGTANAKSACRVAHEWIDANVEPAEVADWLRAGCFNPRWARQMSRAGIRPELLLDDDGRPLHMIDEGPDSEGMSLAQAVTEEYVTVGWAVKYLAAAAANEVG